MKNKWKVISCNTSESTLAMQTRSGVILRVDIKTSDNGVSTSMVYISGAYLKLNDDGLYEIK